MINRNVLVGAGGGITPIGGMKPRGFRIRLSGQTEGEFDVCSALGFMCISALNYP
jgi:hypothetical protein